MVIFMSSLLEDISQMSTQQRTKIEEMLRNKVKEKENQIPMLPRDKNRFPASFTQKRLWFLNSMAVDNPFYNIPAGLRFKGKLDVSILNKALLFLIERHESLRTYFENDSGNIMQIIADKLEYTIPQKDICNYPYECQTKECNRLVMQELGKAFNLGKAPLWGSLLIKISDVEWLLVFSFNHIILDGWSLGILVRELLEVYRAYSKNTAPNLPELDIQYVDYASWHKDYFQKRLEEKQLEYWQNQLSGELPVLQLPTDYNRSDIQTYKGKLHKVKMPEQLYESLKLFTKQNGVTMFMTTIAAFYILINKYSGQEDITIGFPISGRTKSEIEKIVGAFVNTLPIRFNFSNDMTVTDLLSHTRELSLGAVNNQDIPFDKLVQTFHPSRSAGYNPIFQVLFTYQNAIIPGEIDGLAIDFEHLDTGCSKFDLSLDIFEGDDNTTPELIFEYNTDLFKSQKITQIANHYLQLLDCIVKNPQNRIKSLQMMTDEEIGGILKINEQYKLEQDQDSFVDLFEEQVICTPNNVAVSFGEEVLTYEQLNKKANQLARYLIINGAKTGDLIGICLAKSLEMVITIIAVLKAGCAYVPIDPKYPKSKLHYMLENSAAKMIISNSILEIKTDNLFILGEKQDEIALCKEDDLNICLNPDSLAYVIYTSGTTGNPKGTMVTHSNMVSMYRAWEYSYELKTKVRSHLQMASLSFDVCTGDIMRALLSGGKLVICPNNHLLEPEKLYSLMQSEKVECAEFVPAVLRNLIAYLEQNNCTMSYIKLLIVGSDSWYLSECEHFGKFISSDARMINSYGLTEATIDSTFFECDFDKISKTAGVPIGKPFQNTKVYICDSNLQIVPFGVVGEIYIGGAGVAKGYLNNTELTEQRFIDNPFDKKDPFKIYKTGDKARLMQDGNIELIGRNDNQIKIRGIRIELGEIEAAIIKHKLISKCAVVLSSGDSNKLVAFYVAQCSVLDDDLRNYLKDYLPEHMIPSQFIKIDEIPLTANGKVDKKSLLNLVKEDTSFSSKYVPPRTLLEGMLEGIWCHAFKLPRVSVLDDFFALGGHSLLAMQIVTQIREVFNLDISLQVLFKKNTIEGIAEVIAQMQGKEGYQETINAIPVIVPDYQNRYEPFPLTDVQQAYWIGRNDAFEFGNVTTHSYDEFESIGLDIEKFEKAWNKVIARHDMLRAIVRDDGMQQILESVPEYKIAVLDIRHFSEIDADREIDEIRSEMSHQKLYVSNWPVFDVRITMFQKDTYRIHFSTDALIWDALSFVTLIKEITQYYENPDLELPELKLSFRDYVIANENIKNTQRYARAVEYWKDRIHNLPTAPELPMIKSPRDVMTPKFVRYHKVLDKDKWNKMKQKAARVGVTGTGLFLAIYSEVLSLWSKNKDYSLNLTFLNRNAMHPEINDIVGEFTSLILLTVNYDLSLTFLQRVKKIQQDLWDVLEHHDISGIQVIREISRIKGSVSDAKMPVVFTSALILPIPDQENAPMSLKPVYSDGVTQTSQVWLDCGIWEDTKKLFCNWDVVEELYPEGLLRDMFECYWDLVERLADDDSLWQETTIELLPASQKKSIESWNNTKQSTSEEYLHTLFAKQANINPSNIAVISANKKLKYGELYQVTNRLGRKLISLGAKPNQLIAIVMEKGVDQVIAAIGAQNAGAAYLPIDPTLPIERIRYLLEFCGIKIILTQSWIKESIPKSKDTFVITVDDIDLKDYDDSPIEPIQSLDDLAYVIFTSGSTGLPKGVMISHRSAVNTIEDINERLNITSMDRVFAISNLNFDLSVYDIFGTLAAGASIVFPSAEQLLDPAHWYEVVERESVSIWNSVPQLMSLYTEYIYNNDKMVSESLRVVMMSGDWIPLSLPTQICKWCSNPNVEIISLGGATEASIWSVLYTIKETDANWKSIPYGKPMRNQAVHILNEYLNECPIWVTGELYISGAGLSDGYWKDETKTAQSFIIHPKTGERIYKTGDLGKYLPDGNIEFLGREDNQVKIQGYRIELGEIEAVLARFDGVKEAVVKTDISTQGSKILSAFYTTTKDITLNIQDIKEFLKKHLPHYMVPHLYTQISSIPLTPNGKVNPKALKATEINFVPDVNSISEPETEVEKKLAAIWCSIFNTQSINTHDDFFELGGDSMSAIRMIMDVQRDFMVTIPLKILLSNPTIDGLANYIGDISNENNIFM